MQKQSMLASTIALMTLTACGGGGNDGASNKPPPTQPPPTAATFAPAITGYQDCQQLLNGSVNPKFDAADIAVCHQWKNSTTDDVVIFDIAVFDENGNSLEITELSEEPSTTGIEPAFIFRAAKKLPANAKDPYSVVLALDQSGSIATTDPKNIRLDAGKKFMMQNSSPDEMALGFFQGSQFRYVIPRNENKFFSSNPNADGFVGALADFKNTIDGSTPLYDAISSSVNLVTDRGSNANKAVVIFSDGKDTSSRLDLEDAIQHASSRRVPVYTFALDGPDQDISVLQNIANRTDGAFLYASNTGQLISMFGSLGNMLRGRASSYRTHWSIVVNPRSAPHCFANRPSTPGLYVCNVPANLKVKTNRGDVRLRANYYYGFRVA